jgi:hypothetical protein
MLLEDVRDKFSLHEQPSIIPVQKVEESDKVSEGYMHTVELVDVVTERYLY